MDSELFLFQALNSHQRRMSCAFHNAILSEGTKLFEIPARRTIRSHNHYPFEDFFHQQLPIAKHWITRVLLLLPASASYYWKLKSSWLLWLFRASPSWCNAPSMSWISHMSHLMICSWSPGIWNPRYSRDQTCNSWSSHLFAHQCKCHVNPGASLDRASVELWFCLSKSISWSTTATKLDVINMDEPSTAD